MKWDLTYHFKTEEDFKKEFEEVQALIQKLPAYQGKLNEPQSFKEYYNIVEEIDQNLELLNLHHKKDIDEYNLYYQKKIIKKKYIIYGIEKLVYKQGYFDKLLYIVQTGSLAGINVILTASENISLSSILLSSIDQKLILKNDFDFVKHLIDNSYFEILNNNIEGFYKDKDLIVRISLLLMNDEEKNVYLTKKTS